MNKKLYIEPIPSIPINSLRDLIRSLYTNQSGSKRDYARPTYHDKDCTRLECSAFRRSFEDLLTLARTYFPDTTKKELMLVLVDLDLSWTFCGDIGKIVFYYIGSDDICARDFEATIKRTHLKYTDDTYTAKALLDIYNSCYAE